MSSAETRTNAFAPPQEPEWHRMIAEAAYYLAQKRGFLGGHSLDDWLAAEQQVRHVISPLDSEVTMTDTLRQTKSQPEAIAPQATERAGVARDNPEPSRQSKRGENTPPAKDVSRFEKFAATQAAGDGIQGDTLQKDKTVDEKLGANMADRK
jgi:hypothetical protein